LILQITVLFGLGVFGGVFAGNPSEYRCIGNTTKYLITRGV
jgi:hypothetical protein